MDPDTGNIILFGIGGFLLGAALMWGIMRMPPAPDDRRPELSVFYRFTDLLRTLLNRNNKSSAEETIRMLVDVSEETGGIGQNEKEMINNIFEFDDRTASDLMTHRTDLAFIEKDCSLEDIIELSCLKGYSRFPVCEEGIDNLIGMLNVKDLLPLLLDTKKRRTFKVIDYMRKPLFIPESTRCRDLFGMLNGEKTQIAVIVDEYGGTSGIVTMEDLL
ncbi:MAG: CBS domain-containing protein, partial [Angelakisella sp.]